MKTLAGLLAAATSLLPSLCADTRPVRAQGTAARGTAAQGTAAQADFPGGAPGPRPAPASTPRAWP